MKNKGNGFDAIRSSCNIFDSANVLDEYYSIWLIGFLE